MSKRKYDNRDELFETLKMNNPANHFHLSDEQKSHLQFFYETSSVTQMYDYNQRMPVYARYTVINEEYNQRLKKYIFDWHFTPQDPEKRFKENFSPPPEVARRYNILDDKYYQRACPGMSIEYEKKHRVIYYEFVNFICFPPDALQDKISQTHVDTLYNKVNDFTKLVRKILIDIYSSILYYLIDEHKILPVDKTCTDPVSFDDDKLISECLKDSEVMFVTVNKRRPELGEGVNYDYFVLLYPKHYIRQWLYTYNKIKKCENANNEEYVLCPIGNSGNNVYISLLAVYNMLVSTKNVFWVLPKYSEHGELYCGSSGEKIYEISICVGEKCWGDTIKEFCKKKDDKMQS